MATERCVLMQYKSPRIRTRYLGIVTEREVKLKERRNETKMDVETKGVRGDAMRSHKKVETGSMEHGTRSGYVWQRRRRYIKGGERWHTGVTELTKIDEEPHLGGTRRHRRNGHDYKAT